MGKRIIKLKKTETLQDSDQLIIDNNNFTEAKSIDFNNFKLQSIKEGLQEADFTEEEQIEIKEKLGIKPNIPIYYISESIPVIIHGQEVRMPRFSINAVKTLSRAKYLLDTDYSTPMIIVWENNNQFYSFEYEAFCSEIDSNKFGIIINYDKYRITYTTSLQTVAMSIQILLNTVEYSALLDLIDRSLVSN